MALSEAYTINEQTQKLWQLEIELAELLFNLCKQYKLKVWADSGTLLGAVRHQGFIPWDDDMDFVMFREDYEKLLQIAKTVSLPKPYKFGIRPAVIRLYYEGTTMFSEKLKFPDTNNNVGNGGNVWIDIFCMDDCPIINNVFRKAWLKMRWKYRIYNNHVSMSFAYSEGIVGKAWHFFCMLHNVRDIDRHIDCFIKEHCMGHSSSMVSKLVLYLGLPKYKTADKIKYYDKSWWAETVYLPFEKIMIPCPKEYDKILKKMYGDYMVPVKAPTAHGKIIVDLDKPFEEVVKEKLSIIPWYKRFMYKY